MEDTTISDAQAAWSRLRHCASFADWLAVGRALVIGRQHAMLVAKTNRAIGTTYNRAMGAWLAANGLDGISGQERHRVLLVIENLPAIEAWRATLHETQCRRLNHPNSVWWKWKTSQRSGSAVRRKHVAGKNGLSHGAAVHWPQIMLARAAEAIAECRSNDCIVMASAALRAAVRGANDIDELLAARRTVKRSTQPQEQRAAA